jgi:uncharacterized membrane protein YfcA
MMLVFDLAAGVTVGLRNRSLVVPRELARIVPFMLGGMAIGAVALVRAPERLLLGVLGAFVLAYALFGLFARAPRRPLAAAWAAPLGVAGGVFTAMFGTGGPVYTVYLARRIGDAAALRATLSALIVVSAVARLAIFAGVGLYAQDDVLRLAAWLFPCAMLGLYAGSRTYARLSPRRVVQVIWALLLAGGTSLLWRSVAG